MLHPFIARMARAAHLTDDDLVQLLAACRQTRIVAPRQDIIREGDRPEKVHLVLSGFACRYKILDDGRRQVLAFLLPGDLCDLHGSILGEMDHSIAALSTCTVVDLSHETLLQLMSSSERIQRALWWCTLVDKSLLREWLVNMGQRETSKQVAHLLCELLVRLQAVGLADDTSYDLPLTQVDFADALGATVVHVNRVVQALRQTGLIVWKSRRVTIPDPESLRAYCGFTPNYLHLRNPA